MIVRVSAEFTRPANTTAYSAGDVIGPATGQSLITIPCAYTDIAVVGATVESSATQDTTGLLYIVNSPTYAPGLDNAAFTLPGYSDQRVGMIQLSTFATNVLQGAPVAADIAQTSYWSTYYPMKLTDGRIYAALMTVAGFSPASGQQFRISLALDVPDRGY